MTKENINWTEKSRENTPGKSHDKKKKFARFSLLSKKDISPEATSDISFKFKRKIQAHQSFEHLKKLLLKLKNNHGWFIMSTPGQNLYCQLRRNETEEKTRFEAVSHYYNRSLDKKLIVKFTKLGFIWRQRENYRKKIVLDSDDAVNDTALEIMKIFEKIYKVDKQTCYLFEDQIDLVNPRVGDEVYVGTALFLTHGEDDFIGGLCTISKVEKYGDNIWIEVEEDPGTSNSWYYLKELQEELREEFGFERGHKKPDYRKEFNEL
jgi:hypothetical protein